MDDLPEQWRGRLAEIGTELGPFEALLVEKPHREVRHQPTIQQSAAVERFGRKDEGHRNGGRNRVGHGHLGRPRMFDRVANGRPLAEYLDPFRLDIGRDDPQWWIIGKMLEQYVGTIRRRVLEAMELAV